MRDARTNILKVITLFINSPGQRPIGVLELLELPRLLLVPQPRRVGCAPRPSAGKVRGERSRRIPANLPQGHGDL